MTRVLFLILGSVAVHFMRRERDRTLVYHGEEFGGH